MRKQRTSHLPWKVCELDRRHQKDNLSEKSSQDLCRGGVPLCHPWKNELCVTPISAGWSGPKCSARQNRYSTKIYQSVKSHLGQALKSRGSLPLVKLQQRQSSTSRLKNSQKPCLLSGHPANEGSKAKPITEPACVFNVEGHSSGEKRSIKKPWNDEEPVSCLNPSTKEGTTKIEKNNQDNFTPTWCEKFIKRIGFYVCRCRPLTEPTKGRCRQVRKMSGLQKPASSSLSRLKESHRRFKHSPLLPEATTAARQITGGWCGVTIKRV